MSGFSIFKLSPELYQDLAETLGQGGFDSVSIEPDPGPAPGLNYPKDPTEKVVLIRQGDCVLRVCARYDADPAFGYYKGFIWVDRSPRKLRAQAEHLRERVVELLKSNGAVGPGL